MRSSVIACFLVLVSVKRRIIVSGAVDPACPLVEALSPRGIRVSVPDREGMELFAFHGKINAPLQLLETGTMSKDILHTKNGRWIFQDNKIRLRVGDIVNYWVFLRINGLGYRVDNCSAIITVLTQLDENDATCDCQHKAPCSAEISNSLAAAQDAIASTTASTSVHTTTLKSPRECDCTKNELNNISLKLNTTKMQLNVLHEQMESLSSQVESLKELLDELTKDLNIGTQLLLTGQQPPNGNPLEAIRNLITDKLELHDLDEKIQNAQRTSQGIVFDMSSSIEKKRILVRAEKRLTTANYKIIDPQDMENRRSGSYQLDERIAAK